SATQLNCPGSRLTSRIRPVTSASIATRRDTSNGCEVTREPDGEDWDVRMYDFLCRQHTARPGGPGSGAAPAAEQRVALIRRECSPASGSLRSMVDAAGSSSQSIVIGASVSRVAEVIADFARYPEWTGALREAEILEEYEDGYASKVRFVLEAGPVRDEYTLAYEYAEDLTRIEWHLVEPSAVQKAQMGSYDIEDNGDGTCTVTYTLSVE